MVLAQGTRLGSYEIVSWLGGGGMGVVYKAQDTRLGRFVALKFLPAALTRDEEAKKRFMQEARVASSLDHPNICTIYDIAETSDGQLYLALAYYEGETLKHRLERGAMPLEEVADIGLQISRGLDKAHSAGIVHRDIKPANLMITSDGLIKILDFGLAKLVGQVGLTQTGTALGTVAYMSPEQARGQVVDQRTDIWSLGAVLYEMLGGRTPFPGESAQVVIYNILNTEPTPLEAGQGVPAMTLMSMVRRALAKPLTSRYQSVRELQADLSSIGVGVTESRPGSGPASVSAVVVSAAPTAVRRTGFVGREAERSKLRRLLDQSVSGQGALVMIGGEPGVGKTRLTEELLAEARQRGCLALVGHCYEMEGSPPFVPFVEILERTARIVPHAVFREALGDAASEIAKLMPELRRLFPDIPPPLELPAEQQRRYLFNAFQEFSQRATRMAPIVMVLEDLHWADEPTLQLLHHLAPQLNSMAVLAVGTYRDVELDVKRPFAKTLESLLRERQASRIALKRLPESDVAALLSALSGQPAPEAFAKAVYHETEGNPFFVEEVFQHLSEEGRLLDADGRWRADLRIDELEVPEGVRLVIGRRLERLSEHTLRALTIAAVIGRHFELALLEAVGELDADALLSALEEAERAQLVHVTSSGRQIRYTFAHELIRQTLIGDMSLPRRQRLHLRLGDALEKAYGSTVEKHAASLAHHLYQAGAAADAQKAIRFLTLAGEQALTAAAFEDALDHYNKALALVDEQDEKHRADLLYQHGKALYSLGRGSEALNDWRQAIPIYETLGEVESAAGICREMTLLLRWDANPAEAVEVANRGLRLAGDHVTATRCRLAAVAGLSHGVMGDYEAGTALLEQAQAGAEELQDRRLLGEVLSNKAALLWYYLEVRQASDVSPRAVGELRAAGDLWELAYALAVSSFGLWYSGRPHEALRDYEEAEVLARRLGHHAALWAAGISRGSCDLLSSGDLPAYEEFTKGNLERWGGTGGLVRWMSRVLLALGLHYRGEWDEAEAVLRQEEVVVYPLEGIKWGAILLNKAYAGHDDAREMYARWKAELPSPGKPALQGRWALAAWAVEALAVLGDRDEAHKLYPIIEEGLKTGCVVIGFRLIELAAGLAAACGSDWERAERHYQTALRQAQELLFFQPEVRRWHAQMLMDRNAPGDRERASTLLDEAMTQYQQFGMPKHRAMAEALRHSGR